MRLLITLFATLISIPSLLAVPCDPPPSTNKACGGMVPGTSCNADEVCVNDPYNGPDCGMACDAPGVCVKKKNVCGGFAGIQCAGTCVDDPTDDCDPKSGGADCMGLCVMPPFPKTTYGQP